MIINNIANINFGGGGGSDLKLKDMSASYTANGTYSVLPDEGYDGMSKVNVEVNVPGKEEESKYVTVTSNGRKDVSPSSGKVITGLTIMASVPIEINLNDYMSFGYSHNISLFLNKYKIVGGEKRYDWSNIFYNCEYGNEIRLPYITISSASTLMNGFFYNCKNLDYFYFNPDNVNTSRVANMSYMFYGCERLENINLSYFNTDKVTDMSYMFYDCINLKTLNISNFNIGYGVNLNNMFYLDTNLESVDVSACNKSTKNKILAQLQTDLSSYTWTLGDDGIITRSETT